MFDRISNSFALARSSWQVLRENKQLVVFPILSGLACLLILVSFWAPVIFGVGLRGVNQRFGLAVLSPGQRRGFHENGCAI